MVFSFRGIFHNRTSNRSSSPKPHPSLHSPNPTKPTSVFFRVIQIPSHESHLKSRSFSHFFFFVSRPPNRSGRLQILVADAFIAFVFSVILFVILVRNDGLCHDFLAIAFMHRAGTLVNASDWRASV